MKYLFDLPVYRLKEQYYRLRDSYIDRAMYPPDDTYSELMRAKDEAKPHKAVAVRNMFAGGRVIGTPIEKGGRGSSRIHHNQPAAASLTKHAKAAGHDVRLLSPVLAAHRVAVQFSDEFSVVILDRGR
jgi:hypothetical protein